MRAVGVLVPARDEEAHVEACLDAVFAALHRLPPSVSTAVCLLVDRSRDATAAVARRTVRRWAAGPGLRPLVDVRFNEMALPIGELRNRAARAVLDRLGDVPPTAVRLLSTDADSRVPPDWAVRHVELAEAGADAVSGGALPDGSAGSAVLVPDGVYAANLGVGAYPFLAVGGFPAVHSGEDLVLLRRLRRSGHHVVTGAGIYVHTSVRTRGRATGGLADRLRGYSAAPVPPAAPDTA